MAEATSSFLRMFSEVPPAPSEITEIRQAYKLRQQDCADLVGVSLPTWQRWEKGDPKKAGSEMRPAWWDYFRLRVIFNASLSDSANTPERLAALDWRFVSAKLDKHASEIEPVAYHVEQEAVLGVERHAVSHVRGTVRLAAVNDAAQKVAVVVPWSVFGRTDGTYSDLYDFGPPVLDPYGGRVSDDLLINDGTGDPLEQRLTQAALCYRVAQGLSDRIKENIRATLTRVYGEIPLYSTPAIVRLTRTDGQDVVFEGDCIADVRLEPSRRDAQLPVHAKLYRSTREELHLWLENYTLITDFPCQRVVTASDISELLDVLGHTALSAALEKALMAYMPG